MKPEPCPFCASLKISPGEVLPSGGWLHAVQAECLNCGATGPTAMLDENEPDAAAKAIEAWNRRAATKQGAELRQVQPGRNDAGEMAHG